MPLIRCTNVFTEGGYPVTISKRNLVTSCSFRVEQAPSIAMGPGVMLPRKTFEILVLFGNFWCVVFVFLMSILNCLNQSISKHILILKERITDTSAPLRDRHLGKSDPSQIGPSHFGPSHFGP